jgi:hypothetical protein
MNENVCERVFGLLARFFGGVQDKLVIVMQGYHAWCRLRQCVFILMSACCELLHFYFI